MVAHLSRGGLAGARRSDDGHHLAFFHGQGDILDYGEIAETLS